MGNINKTRLWNASQLLREIWYSKSVSRVDLSGRLGLNKSSVTHIVRELLDYGVLTFSERGEPGPKGGRRPVLLKLNQKYGAVIGVEVRPESLSLIAVDLEGEILFYTEKKVYISGENFRDVYGWIKEIIEENQELFTMPLLGIGVGVSGIVDPQHGKIITSIPLGILEEYDFSGGNTLFSDIPVYIDNDANCCAWGELVFHRDANLNNFIFVLVEFRDSDKNCSEAECISVGFGLAINGTVHYGDGYLSGEFKSIFADHHQSGQFKVTTHLVDGNFNNNKVLNDFISELSRNLALLVNTFNLSQVFLGGDIQQYRVTMCEVLQKEIRRNWPYPFPVEREVLVSSLESKAVAFGAAGMVLNRLFNDFEKVQPKPVHSLAQQVLSVGS